MSIQYKKKLLDLFIGEYYTADKLHMIIDGKSVTDPVFQSYIRGDVLTLSVGSRACPKFSIEEWGYFIPASLGGKPREISVETKDVLMIVAIDGGDIVNSMGYAHDRSVFITQMHSGEPQSPVANEEPTQQPKPRPSLRVVK